MLYLYIMILSINKLRLITLMILLTITFGACPLNSFGACPQDSLRPVAAGEKDNGNKLTHETALIIGEKISKTAVRLINKLDIIKNLGYFSDNEMQELVIIFNKMTKMTVEFIPEGLIELMPLRDGPLSLDNAQFNICAEHFLELSDIELEASLLHEATHLLSRQIRRQAESENIAKELPEGGKAVYSDGADAQKYRKEAIRAALLHLKNECEAYEVGIEYTRVCSPNYFAYLWHGNQGTYLSRSTTLSDMATALRHKKRQHYVILVLYSGSISVYRQIELRWLFAMQSPIYKDTLLWNIRLRGFDIEFERQFEDWVYDEFAEVHTASDILQINTIEASILRPLAASEQP